MAELPSGTVSLLFSDIEGSTALLSRLGPSYVDALDGHREVLRTAWAGHGGTELGTEGDSFFVVFPTAEGAVAAATQAQRELAAFDWSGGEPVRVRMGIHTGTPTVHDGGYVGMDVHRAARIAGAAHGGQVVISSATAELVGGRLPERVDLRDLGNHRLKDIARPERLLQLAIEGLPGDFPPIKTLGAATSLPTPLTPLVGRDSELAELNSLLSSPQVRLVTLTGPGGSGKTRLAIALAQELVERFPDGVFFVPMAAANDADVMWASIAEVLDVPPEGRIPPGFLDHVAHRNALFVLDNLEQISGADTVVADLLNHAPKAVAIVTSRKLLTVPGEHVHPVPPLGLPEGTGQIEAEASGAIQLFDQHARKVKPSFTLTADNVADVTAICRRLDGLPLAIELAAARVRVLTPKALLARLDNALDIASGNQAHSRQKTLRATIAWSYDLLGAKQQGFFRRLGVFAGGADLDAITAITAVTADIFGDADSLDLVGELDDASLAIITEGDDGEPRLALLQTVADFALDALAAAGDEEEARARHAEYFLLLAERLVSELRTNRGMAAQNRLLTETDNFRAALDWTLQPKAVTPPSAAQARMGLRLCAKLGWLWTVHTYLPEVRRWTQRALDLDSGADTPERARVLLAQSGWWDAPADPRSQALLEQALGICRRLNDPAGIALALADLADQHIRAGRLDKAAEFAKESVVLAQVSGDSPQLAHSIHVHGRVATEQREFGLAVELFERAQDLNRQRGEEAGVIWGDVAIAKTLATSGRAGEAANRLHRVAADVLKWSNPLLSGDTLAAYAHTCAALGEAERAARLLGAHWALWAAIGEPVNKQSPEEQAWLEESGITAARDTLDEDLWEEALETGAHYTLEEAFADARQANIRTAQPPGTAIVENNV